MKRVLSSVGRAFKNNLHLKIIAILAAIILWVYVMSDTNPIRSVTVENVAVGTQGTQELAEKHLTVVGDELSEIIYVSVNVNVGQQDMASVNASTVNAMIDLSTINAPGEYEMKIHSTSPTDSTVVGTTPSTMTINVESLVTRDVPVTVVTQGEAPTGYYIATPQVTPSLLTIEGTESIIERVSSAVCTVDLSSYTEDTTQSMNVALFDAQGEEIHTTGISSEFPSVVVAVDVSEKKILTIDEDTAIRAITNVAEGFEVTGVTVTPAQIDVVGENLENVMTLGIDSVDAGGANSDVTLNARLSTIDGVSFINGRNISMQVQISEKTDTVEFENVDIALQDELEIYDYILSEDTATVTVRGTLSALSEITADDLNVYVSVQGLLAGAHDVTVHVDFPQIEGIASATVQPNGISLDVSRQ